MVSKLLLQTKLHTRWVWWKRAHCLACSTK